MDPSIMASGVPEKHQRLHKFITSFCARFASAEAAQKAVHSEFIGEGSGLGFVCRVLVEAAGPTASRQFLGESPEAHAEVSQWLSFSSAISSEKVLADARLQLLNVHFSGRSVLAGKGTDITVADLSLFAAIHDLVAQQSSEEQEKLPNLLRWIDFIQNKEEAAQVFEHIPVTKAKFNPPGYSPSSSTTKQTPTAAPTAKASSASKLQEESDSQPSASSNKKEIPIKAEGKGIDKVGGPVKPDEVTQDGKKAKKEKPPAQKKESDTSISVLDIRVGIIKKVWKHPGADALYVEEIDIGEENVRQVVSGLAKFLTEEQMLNRRVLVLKNVKAGKVRDVISSGLVLCASNSDHSQCAPVAPPEGALIGERATVLGHEGTPEEVLNPKKKQFEKIQLDLGTDSCGVANYQGKPFLTSAGPCTSTIVNGTIK